MNKTTNYQLNQWEPEDQVRRTDFNEDNAKLDAALAGLQTALAGKAAASTVAALQTAVYGKGNCRIAYGSYVGDGNVNATISLTTGFPPKAVLVVGDSSFLPLIWNAGTALSYSKYNYAITPVWRADGVSWTLDRAYENPADGMLNAKNKTYYYVALG